MVTGRKMWAWVPMKGILAEDLCCAHERHENRKSEEQGLARAAAGSSPHGAEVWAGFEGKKTTIAGTDAQPNTAAFGKSNQVGKDRRKDS